MMENQELNSKSEDTQKIEKTPEKGLVVESLATPYRAFVHVEVEDLQKAFDVFWDTHGSLLVEKSGYKGKKKKGGKVDLKKARKSLEKSFGINQLYKTPIAAIAEQAVNEYYEEEGKRVLFISEVTLQRFDKRDPYIVAIFHFWPKLRVELDELNWCVPRHAPRNMDKALAGRVLDLQNKHKFYELVEGNDLDLQMEVLVDIITSLENEAYEEGTVRKAWYKIADIFSDELREVILSHKKGDLFEATFKNPLPGDKKDKEVSAHIKIYDARWVRLLDPEDVELYKAEGFESKEAFVEKFDKEYNQYMDNAERHLAFDSIINQIAMSGAFDPIPQRWIDLNSQYMIVNHMKSFKDDLKTAMSAVGAADEAQYKKMFESQVLKDTINQMAVESYASYFDLPNDPEKVADHILEKVTWSDPQV